MGAGFGGRLRLDAERSGGRLSHERTIGDVPVSSEPGLPSDDVALLHRQICSRLALPIFLLALS